MKEKFARTHTHCKLICIQEDPWRSLMLCSPPPRRIIYPRFLLHLAPEYTFGTENTPVLARHGYWQICSNKCWSCNSSDTRRWRRVATEFETRSPRRSSKLCSRMEERKKILILCVLFLKLILFYGFRGENEAIVTSSKNLSFYFIWH